MAPPLPPFVSTLVIRWRADAFCGRLVLSKRHGDGRWTMPELDWDLSQDLLRAVPGRPAHLLRYDVALDQTGLVAPFEISSMHALEFLSGIAPSAPTCRLLGELTTEQAASLAKPLDAALGRQLNRLRCVAREVVERVQITGALRQHRKEILNSIWSGRRLNVLVVGLDATEQALLDRCEALLKRVWPYLDEAEVCFLSEAEVLVQHCLSCPWLRADVLAELRADVQAASCDVREGSVLFCDFGEYSTELSMFWTMIPPDDGVTLARAVFTEDSTRLPLQRIPMGAGHVTADFGYAATSAVFGCSPDFNDAYRAAYRRFEVEKCELGPDDDVSVALPTGRLLVADRAAVRTWLDGFIPVLGAFGAALQALRDAREHDDPAQRLERIVFVTGDTLRMRYVCAEVERIARELGFRLFVLTAHELKLTTRGPYTPRVVTMDECVCPSPPSRRHPTDGPRMTVCRAAFGALQNPASLEGFVRQGAFGILPVDEPADDASSGLGDADSPAARPLRLRLDSSVDEPGRVRVHGRLEVVAPQTAVTVVCDPVYHKRRYGFDFGPWHLSGRNVYEIGVLGSFRPGFYVFELDLFLPRDGPCAAAATIAADPEAWKKVISPQYGALRVTVTPSPGGPLRGRPRAFDFVPTLELPQGCLQLGEAKRAVQEKAAPPRGKERIDRQLRAHQLLRFCDSHHAARARITEADLAFARGLLGGEHEGAAAEDVWPAAWSNPGSLCSFLAWWRGLQRAPVAATPRESLAYRQHPRSGL
ncbi:hypothetical protein GQ53DRAFT_100231 [Thozetella sp. PMI_491]|nr:hypothetical protein GQ53DRAFT_100231 [Thozetella sp. PMI_491]